MAAVVLTAAQARALGIYSSPRARAHRQASPAPRAPRREAWPYATRCHDCSTEFVSAAAEDRHLDETHHSRYEVIL
jgi:hypothetical protein